MATFLRTTEIPIHGARTLPGSAYTSPAVLQRERERIFFRRWLCAGREAELAEPGSYFLVETGTESAIVVRGRDGEVRAFHNVCRHRGSRLCEEHTGRFDGHIQCPYHAWTYGLDGRLLGAPSTAGLEGFDRSDWPLASVAAATWEGFVFINFAENPEPFNEAFAPMLGRLDRFNLPALRSYRRVTYDVRANWKLLFENYSECYHCASVHPGLAKLSPPTSGENDLVEGAILGGFMTLNDELGSLSMTGRACGVPVATLPPEDMSRVYYYSLFPNCFLSLHPDYVMYHMVWPEAPDRTRIACEWLFHPDSFGHPQLQPDDGIEFWDMTNRQDWHICEQTQLGVSSRAYRPGPFSPRESLAVAFDREVRRSLESEE